MITKPNHVSIVATRVTSRASDGAGGYVPTSSAIPGSPFAGRILRKAAIRTSGQIEARQGDISIDEVVLVFPAGSDIRAGDVCMVGDTSYTVQAPRSYKRSVQADVLAVH